MAAQVGYASCWTPTGVGQDAFQVCAQWWGASRAVVPRGLATGIAVVPVPRWSVPALATAAARPYPSSKTVRGMETSRPRCAMPMTWTRWMTLLVIM